MDLLGNLEKAMQLPLGHYGRDQAKNAVTAEYKQCHDLERVWAERFPVRIFDSLQEAANFCHWLCVSIGSRPVRKVVRYSPAVHRMASAHYDPIFVTGCACLSDHVRCVRLLGTARRCTGWPVHTTIQTPSQST